MLRSRTSRRGEYLALRIDAGEPRDTAARGGDLDALVDLLDPDVVARSDGGTLRPSAVRRGATDVASNAITFARFAAAAVPVLVNGIPGALAMAQGKPLSLTAFTVRNGKIVALDILTDPHRLAGIGLGHTPDG
ncbi:hypothetical protein [Streptomyces sp. NPDC020817]|uniref:hypothetical protein n=1 Tax=Streptomyces sp. NPDC020817 TaxID=3365095 RepID=UPI0037A89287